ncbi:MAG: PDZ domain-containing protein [Gemmatimonadaceae bacterium]
MKSLTRTLESVDRGEAGRGMVHSTARVAVLALLTMAVALPIRAQGSAPDGADASPRTSARVRDGEPDLGAMLGMNVSASGTDRDTLGLLISNITRGGPADQAGVDEGNRLAAINGVSTRIDGESVGQRDATDGVFRRLARELSALRSGDDVTLKLFGGGRFRTVTLHPAIAAPARPAPAPARTVPAAVPTPSDNGTQPASIASVADGLSVLQAQLRRLEQGEAATPTLDSLQQIEQDLGTIRRRLRDLQSAPDRRASARTQASDAIPGILVGTVADELVPYFGDGSQGGLLVLKADESWDPIRAGDVILTVNDAPATAEKLRAAHESRRSSTIEVLRRKRVLTLTYDGAQ